MIYNCKYCGAQFSTDLIRIALKQNDSFIRCNYCGETNEFGDVKASHIARGFDHLALGKFADASSEFSIALRESEKHTSHRPSPDVYLGYALAQFQVQTIFADDDPYKLNPPLLICHRCNESYLVDNENYKNALLCADEGMNESSYHAEQSQLRHYAETVDGIKDYYEEIKRERGDKFFFNVFIAYEDEGGDSDDGYNIANSVRNKLPDKLKNVYLPDIYECGNNKLRYEAEIMYAIDHSKCMLVITDNNIDFRLTNIFSRYYFAQGGEKSLAFLRYRDKITVTLPNQRIASNVFEIEDKKGYSRFACLKNGILYKEEEEKEAEPAPEAIEDTWEQPTITTPIATSGAAPYKELAGGQYEFGSFPQKRETSAKVEQYFEKLGRPSAQNAAGWTAMVYSKAGNPIMWYRDGEVDGKKYRAVFFTKFRDVYSVQNSDLRATEQRVHGYMPYKIYCFAYQPLLWNKIPLPPSYRGANIAFLISDQGIDSREYNNSVMDNDWESSTLRRFLNDEFLYDAFTDGEQEWLFADGDDKVFLPDQSEAKDLIAKDRKVMASDYYRCVGGMGENNSISGFWVKSENYGGSEAPTALPNYEKKMSAQYVDRTTVAVTPKIIIKL